MNNKQILIVHPFIKFTRNKNNYFLREAENLVEAIDLECVESSLLGLEKISPKTFINKGNLIIFKKMSCIPKSSI